MKKTILLISLITGMILSGCGNSGQQTTSQDNYQITPQKVFTKARDAKGAETQSTQDLNKLNNIDK